MTPENPVAARYLDRLTRALDELDPAERAEVVQEIAQHLKDAQAAGRPLDELLTSLGSAEELARAYRVELLLNPKDRRHPRRDRWLRITGLVALGSIPTLVIVVTLFSLGLSLSLSGIVVFVAGIWAATGPLPDWVNLDCPPWVAITLAFPVTALGVASFAGLVLYLRFTARVVRRLVPRARPATV